MAHQFIYVLLLTAASLGMSGTLHAQQSAQPNSSTPDVTSERISRARDFSATMAIGRTKNSWKKFSSVAGPCPPAKIANAFGACPELRHYAGCMDFLRT